MENDSPEADRIAQAIGEPGSITMRRHTDDTPETVTRWSTRAVISTLNEIAATNPTALLGTPERVSVQYDVCWHGEDPYADRRAGIRLSHNGYISHLARALDIADQQLAAGNYGITHYTIHRREHRTYSHGTSWTGVWIRLELPELIWKDGSR